jgi:hypothetical protein
VLLLLLGKSVGVQFVLEVVDLLPPMLKRSILGKIYYGWRSLKRPPRYSSSLSFWFLAEAKVLMMMRSFCEVKSSVVTESLLQRGLGRLLLIFG